MWKELNDITSEALSDCEGFDPVLEQEGLKDLVSDRKLIDPNPDVITALEVRKNPVGSRRISLDSGSLSRVKIFAFLLFFFFFFCSIVYSGGPGIMIFFSDVNVLFAHLTQNGVSKADAYRKINSLYGKSLSKHPNFRLIHALVVDILKMTETPDANGKVFQGNYQEDAAFLGVYLGRYGGVDAMRFAVYAVKAKHPNKNWGDELAQAFDCICGFEP